MAKHLFQKGNKICIGRKPWNKGIKVQNNTGKTHFKKGHTPTLGMTGKHHSDKMKKEKSEFNKRTGIRPPIVHLKDEKSGQWKGENAGYGSKHAWIKSRKGYPPFCEDCGKTGEKINGRWNIEWSNVDHKYRRVKEDYIGRCRQCHSNYDYKNNKYINGSKTGTK